MQWRVEMLFKEKWLQTCCVVLWKFGSTLYQKFVQIMFANEVRWPLRGGCLGVVTCGSWTQLVPVARWWRWCDRTGTALLSTCRLSNSLRRHGAPAEWQPKSSLLIGQAVTNQQIIRSLAYKEELRAHRWGLSGLPLHCLWSSVMTTGAPLLGPWTRTTRCFLCHSFVTTTCRLWGITREDGTASKMAQTWPVGSAGRQRPEVEPG